MFRIFFKIARRHLWRSRRYACINILGLTLGLVSVLFAAFFVLDEANFDNFHDNSPNLYRITTTAKTDGQVQTTGGTGQVQGPVFKSQIPEILNFTRLMGGDIYGDVRVGEKALKLQLLFVDDSFFDVFTFKLRSGSPKSALKDVNSVVLTEKTAMRFFGRLDVIGEKLQMDNDPSARRIGKPLIVSGVVETPPSNSSIQFDILFPFRFMQVSFDDSSWLNAYLGTFVVLHPSADLAAVERKFNTVFQQNAGKQLTDNFGSSRAQPRISYGLQPVTDIHLNPQEISDQNREGGVVNGSRPVYSYLFLGIALFILFMASVNFININLATSLKRGKEIGVRKVTGATQRQIIGQFLGESALLCLTAFFLAVALSIFLMPVFNQLSGKNVSLATLPLAQVLATGLAILLLNILISGLYPALLLSKYNPVEVLYQKQSLSGRNQVGNFLVVFQFAIAIILGVGTLVVQQQMQFTRTKDLGYNPGQIVSVKIPGLADTRRMGVLFKNELKAQSGVESIAVSGEFGMRDSKAGGRNIRSYYRSIDQEYLSMLGIVIKNGRGFSRDDVNDGQHNILVNEAFLNAAGWKDAIGQQIKADSYFGNEVFTVIGVVKNFHIDSFREHIQPMVMVASTSFGGDMILSRLAQNQQDQSLKSLENTFRKLLPGAVFEASMLNDQNASRYKEELRWQKIISLAAICSLLICMIGLYAMAHLAIAQRRKETGIRMVLGARALNIVILFSNRFVKMIAVSVLIASPLSFYFANIWLTGFAYRIVFQVWYLLLPGISALIITLITVGAQAMQASRINPVQSITSE